MNAKAIRLYAPSIRINGHRARALVPNTQRPYQALDKESAVRRYQDWLLQPLLYGVGAGEHRELRPVPAVRIYSYSVAYAGKELPPDMLRYDEVLHVSPPFQYDRGQTIFGVMGQRPPTVDRWRSFGAQVTSSVIEEFWEPENVPHIAQGFLFEEGARRCYAG